MYIYIYTYSYTHLYTYTHTYLSLSIYIYIYLSLSVYIYVFTLIITCVYIHTYINTSLSLYIYTYIYIYTHTCTSTHCGGGGLLGGLAEPSAARRVGQGLRKPVLLVETALHPLIGCSVVSSSQGSSSPEECFFTDTGILFLIVFLCFFISMSLLFVYSKSYISNKQIHTCIYMYTYTLYYNTI